MKNATQFAKKLSALLKELRATYELPEHEPVSPMHTMVFAFLAYDASIAEAEEAYERIMGTVIDFTDLRITDPLDLIHLIGDDYPQVISRVAAMQDTLHGVYNREHATRLSVLTDMNKRDARAYLEKLPSIPPFVTASVMCLSLGAHAIPTDTQLVNVLKHQGIADLEADLSEVNSFLETNIKAADGVSAYYLLRAYVDDAAATEKAAAPGEKAPKSSGRKTTKKKTTKAS